MNVSETVIEPAAASGDVYPLPHVPHSAWPLALRLYGHILEGTWNAFGLSPKLLTYGLRRPLVLLATRTLMALDHVLVPGFRRTPVVKPVFVLGHPRSGTTFVHRLLTQTREFAVFELWETFLPALCVRPLVRPLVRRIVARGGGVYLPKEAGHLSALTEVEEEDMLLLLTGNTQFTANLTPLAFADWDFTELVLGDEQSPRERKRATRFLRSCLQRQLYATGLPRAVTKMVYSAPRAKSLLEEFPDARFVYLVRSPLETIPSHLSLDRNMFDHLWGLERIPTHLLQRYYERRYQHALDFYRYVERLIDSRAIPEEQLLVIKYDDLRSQLAATMDRVIAFAELPCSDRLRELIQEQSQAQARYERPHKNAPLDEFGLGHKRIVDDLAPVFDKYGFARE
jgi:hypothetical protein